jgi:UDP-glucose 4-epimerase
VEVFGTDYPTRDGTGIRDYVHVMDLAEAHVAAVKCVMRPEETTADIYQAVNIGTGQGWSVLEMIRAMEKVHGCHIPYTFTSRRPGDVASSVFDVQAAKNGRLKWSAKRCSIEELCCANNK